MDDNTYDAIVIGSGISGAMVVLSENGAPQPYLRMHGF